MRDLRDIPREEKSQHIAYWTDDHPIQDRIHQCILQEDRIPHDQINIVLKTNKFWKLNGIEIGEG